MHNYTNSRVLKLQMNWQDSKMQSSNLLPCFASWCNKRINIDCFVKYCCRGWKTLDFPKLFSCQAVMLINAMTNSFMGKSYRLSNCMHKANWALCQETCTYLIEVSSLSGNSPHSFQIYLVSSSHFQNESAAVRKKIERTIHCKVYSAS